MGSGRGGFAHREMGRFVRERQGAWPFVVEAIRFRHVPVIVWTRLPADATAPGPSASAGVATPDSKSGARPDTGKPPGDTSLPSPAIDEKPPVGGSVAGIGPPVDPSRPGASVPDIGLPKALPGR